MGSLNSIGMSLSLYNFCINVSPFVRGHVVSDTKSMNKGFCGSPNESIDRRVSGKKGKAV